MIKSSRGGCCPQGANKKGSGAGDGKSKGQGKDRNSHAENVEHVDESSWNETSQADASINKTVPEVWISRS